MERENKSGKEFRIALALAGLLAVGSSIAVYKIAEETVQAQRECVSTRQIDTHGQRLESFVSGKGCERFVKPYFRPYSYPSIGGW